MITTGPVFIESESRMFHWSIDFQTFSTIFTSEPLLEELLISGNIILHPMALYLISVIDSDSEGIYNQCISLNDHIYRSIKLSQRSDHHRPNLRHLLSLL